MTSVIVALLGLAVGVLAVIVFGLLRTHAEILRALNRHGIRLDDASSSESLARHRSGGEGSGESQGQIAHDVVGVSPSGAHINVTVAGVERLTLLAFMSSGCHTCKVFWDTFAAPGFSLPGERTRLVIVGQDPAYDSVSAFADLVPDGIKAVLSSAAWGDYGVPGSPYFVLVDGTSRQVVGAGTSSSWEQMRRLVTEALDDERHSRRAGQLEGVRPRRSSRGERAGRRSDRADDALRSAGIGPDHASVSPRSAESEQGQVPRTRTPRR